MLKLYNKTSQKMTTRINYTVSRCKTAYKRRLISFNIFFE